MWQPTRSGAGSRREGGKDLVHINRAGACTARPAVLGTVSRGARECLVTLMYAPNVAEPLDVRFEIDGSGRSPTAGRFRHDRIREALVGWRKVGSLGQGTHFFDLALPWNGGHLQARRAVHGGSKLKRRGHFTERTR